MSLSGEDQGTTNVMKLTHLYTCCLLQFLESRIRATFRLLQYNELQFPAEFLHHETYYEIKDCSL